jgi:hypothetical protein
LPAETETKQSPKEPNPRHPRDSLPSDVPTRIIAETKDGDIHRLLSIDRYPDKGRGAYWLRRADIATLIEDTLLHFDAQRDRHRRQ